MSILIHQCDKHLGGDTPSWTYMLVLPFGDLVLWPRGSEFPDKGNRTALLEGSQVQGPYLSQGLAMVHSTFGLT